MSTSKRVTELVANASSTPLTLAFFDLTFRLHTRACACALFRSHHLRRQVLLRAASLDRAEELQAAVQLDHDAGPPYGEGTAADGGA